MPRQNGVGHDNRAGVDKGIVRDTAIVLELNDGIEGRARRLAPDAPPKNIAHLPERHREGEDFRDALDREALVGVAGGQDRAIDARHRDAELVGVQLAKLWDVVGKASLTQAWLCRPQN